MENKLTVFPRFPRRMEVSESIIMNGVFLPVVGLNTNIPFEKMETNRLPEVNGQMEAILSSQVDE